MKYFQADVEVDVVSVVSIKDLPVGSAGVVLKSNNTEDIGQVHIAISEYSTTCLNSVSQSYFNNKQVIDNVLVQILKPGTKITLTVKETKYRY